MSVSKAHIEATNRYNAKNYKQLKVNVRFNDYDFIDNYCKTNNISKASLVLNSVKYCINNNIDIKNQNAVNGKDEDDNDI